MKQVTTLDPVSMHDVNDIENAPFVIEGEGQKAIKIYFENEANKALYLETSPDASLPVGNQSYERSMPGAAA